MAADEQSRVADESEVLLVERDRPVAVLTLNRPGRLNALSWRLIGELADSLHELAADSETRAVVLTGAGRAFSAGGDVRDQAERVGWGAAEKAVRAEPMLEAIRAVWEFPKPLIAALNGVAAGAGAGLALLCDVRYASREARLGFAFARVGLGPDYGVSYTLPRVVGPGTAARLLFTADYVDADDALRIGLVDNVVESGSLHESATELAHAIAARAPFGVRLAKQALRRSLDVDFATALRTEMSAQFVATQTEDHREGASAFLEKREPRFTGR